jgi:hypothetical protein
LTMNFTKYDGKLQDIQSALTLVVTDVPLIISICNEMAFHWVPSILADLTLLNESNHALQIENDQMHLQNDALLKQNVFLSQQLNNQ